MKKITDFIINKRYWILSFFIILLVISTINNSENEPIFTTDTFHFVEDEVLVNSNSSDLGEIEYEIPLYSSLIRK